MRTPSSTRDTVDFYQTLPAAPPTTAVSVLLKIRGETCDIDCLYCYEKRKEAPGGARLAADHVDRIPRIFGDRPIAVEIHGGEPLTAGRDYIAALLDHLTTLPTVVKISLQTNAVRLDSGWADLLVTHCPGIEIGVSLDGDAHANAWRVGYDGRPTHARVSTALHLLGDRGITVGIISVVTPRALGRAAQILDHLTSFRTVRAVSFVPCMDAAVRTTTARTTSRVTPSRALQRHAITAAGPPTWSTTSQQYTDFVLDAAHHWIDAGLFRRVSLEPTVAVIRRLHGLDVRSCHFTNLKCDHVFTAYPDGRLGSCDELPWPAAQLTTLTLAADTPTQLTSAQAASNLLSSGRALMAKCRTCSYRSTCGGGCISSRLRETHAVGHDIAYCDYRMRLIDGTAALLAAPQDRTGVHCQRIRWRERTPNTMRDIRSFLARWDNPRAHRPSVPLARSPHGNINTTGETGGASEAPDLDPHHPQWPAGIEPRVWPVVETLTGSWGTVTYDSCEGHAHEGSGHPPVPLRVGILPRDRREAAALAHRLCHAAARLEGLLHSSYALAITRSLLTCETTRERHPTLDVHLEPTHDNAWADYDEGLPTAVAALTAALHDTAPRTRPQRSSAADTCAACACHEPPAIPAAGALPSPTPPIGNPA